MLSKTYFIGLEGRVPLFSKNLEHSRYLSCAGYPIFADYVGEPYRLAKKFYKDGNFLIVLEEFTVGEMGGHPFTDVPLEYILRNAVSNTYLFMTED
jgi:hypothetical protein